MLRECNHHACILISCPDRELSVRPWNLLLCNRCNKEIKENVWSKRSSLMMYQTRKPVVPDFIPLRRDFPLLLAPWDQSRPLLQIPDIFSNQDISLSTLTPPPPPPLPPPPPPRYGRFFNRWFTFFLRELDNIWLFKQVFRRALTKKKMVNPNPNPPHPPPPRYGRFLNRWFKFFLREGLWQKHMALDNFQPS